MNDLIAGLRREAARNAQMQGDKDHQTNRRRKTFRGRNHLFTKAADHIEKLDSELETNRVNADKFDNQSDRISELEFENSFHVAAAKERKRYIRKLEIRLDTVKEIEPLGGG